MQVLECMLAGKARSESEKEFTEAYTGSGINLAAPADCQLYFEFFRSTGDRRALVCLAAQ